MLRGPIRLAQTALACVCTTALGLFVVPDVNMIPNGRSGSMRAARPARGVAAQVVEGVEAVRRLVAVRRLAAVSPITATHFRRRRGVGDVADELRLGDRGDARGVSMN